MAALQSTYRDQIAAAVNQLHAFQNQVRAQVAPANPQLGENLIGAAQEIMDALRAPEPEPEPIANMVWIEPGSFMMGSPIQEAERWEDEIQHEVTISRGFWIGKYEVTQAEYLGIVGNNPSYFTLDLNRPVEQVTWSDAIQYCELLTEQEQLAGRLPMGYAYCLPTEAQWEYACRAGTSTRFSHGDDSAYAQLGDYAWYLSNSGATTHPVGQKQPNPWGLYDMHGNVWEWCQDWYDLYPVESVTDPTGPASGLRHVYRGGSCMDRGRGCRSARRLRGLPSISNSNLGFRVVLTFIQR